jgi:hypothetical protein
LRYNHCLIASSQGTSGVRAQRLRAFSALRPNLSVKGERAFEDTSLKEIGLKLPPSPAFRVCRQQAGLSAIRMCALASRNRCTASGYTTGMGRRRRLDRHLLSARGMRETLSFTLWQLRISRWSPAQKRVETARAQLASAQELDQQTAGQVKTEVSPEID